jgi:hypothetical protein
MAYDLFAMPAMSCECERTFSSGKRLIAEQNLKSGIIEVEQCIKTWLKNGIPNGQAIFNNIAAVLDEDNDITDSHYRLINAPIHAYKYALRHDQKRGRLHAYSVQDLQLLLRSLDWVRIDTWSRIGQRQNQVLYRQSRSQYYCQEKRRLHVGVLGRRVRQCVHNLRYTLVYPLSTLDRTAVWPLHGSGHWRVPNGQEQKVRIQEDVPAALCLLCLVQPPNEALICQVGKTKRDALGLRASLPKLYSVVRRGAVPIAGVPEHAHLLIHTTRGVWKIDAASNRFFRRFLAANAIHARVCLGV